MGYFSDEAKPLEARLVDNYRELKDSMGMSWRQFGAWAAGHNPHAAELAGRLAEREEPEPAAVPVAPAARRRGQQRAVAPGAPERG